MEIGKGLHLTYCSNIHPGEAWEDHFRQLKTYLPLVKQRVSPDRPFGLGLRIANQATKDLLKEGLFAEMHNWLKANDMYVFTINGFPYGGFHRQVVKDLVHEPDWTNIDRVDYTERLFDLLSNLLPEGVEGSISTSPLSYKPWYKGKSSEKQKGAFRLSALHLAMVVEQIYSIKKTRGKNMYLAIEPEPDGLLENTQEVIAFFDQYLVPLGSKQLMRQLEIPEDEAIAAIYDHVRLCYDVCHFALEYEDPAEVLAKLNQANIRVGKIQISSALKANLTENMEHRDQIKRELNKFMESTYLHQVITRSKNGKLTNYADLAQGLEPIFQPDLTELRTHFHVPIFVETYGRLSSTQSDIVRVAELMRQAPFTQHLEVETYTWEVLPKDLQTDLAESISRELEWAAQRFRPA